MSASAAEGRRVVRNSLVRTAGFGAGAAVQVVVFVLIARYLGVERLGHYTFVMAVAGMFQMVADMGVRDILVRDIARDRAALAARLGAAHTLLSALSFLAFAGIVLVSQLANLPDDVRTGMILAGAAVMVTFHALGWSAVLRAFEEMDLDILGFALHKLAFLGLVLLVRRTDSGIRGVFLAMLGANAVLYLYFRVVVAIRHGRVERRTDLGAARALLLEALPLGVAELMRRATWQIDRVLLLGLGSAAAVGLYSTAYKFIEAARPLLFNLTLPLFPVLARLAGGSRERLFSHHQRSVRVLCALGAAPAAVLLVLADRAVPLVFGPSFAGAVAPLRLLAPVLLLLPATAGFGFVFTSIGKPRLYAVAVGACLAVNAVLDLLLIPRFGPSGAAVATVAAEVALYGVGIHLLRAEGARLPALGLLWRPLLAALVVIGAGFAARDLALLPLALVTLASLAGYAALLLALGAVTPADIELLRVALAARTTRRGARAAGAEG